MADRVLFIGWDAPVRGREERSLEVFNEAIGHDGRLQLDGRIESFDIVLLEPGGDAGGYVELHGSAQQLATVREDDEFRRPTIDAQLVVDAAADRRRRRHRGRPCRDGGVCRGPRPGRSFGACHGMNSR